MTNAIFAFIGGIIGVWVGHRLTVWRDKAAKKDAFVGFLEKWKSDICAPKRGPTEINLAINSAIKVYDSNLGEFHKQVAIARSAFSKNSRFDALTTRLGSLTNKDWNNSNAREVIVNAIERLTESCKD